MGALRNLYLACIPVWVGPLPACSLTAVKGIGVLCTPWSRGPHSARLCVLGIVRVASPPARPLHPVSLTQITTFPSSGCFGAPAPLFPPTSQAPPPPRSSLTSLVTSQSISSLSSFNIAIVVLTVTVHLLFFLH